MNIETEKNEMQQVITYMKAERDRKGRYIPYGEAVALWLTNAESELSSNSEV